MMISTDAPVVIEHVALAQLVQEVFVVRDDDQLEVGLVASFFDDTARFGSEKACQSYYFRQATLGIRPPSAIGHAGSLCQTRRERFDILLIQISRRFVQGEDTTIVTERVGKGESDDD